MNDAGFPLGRLRACHSLAMVLAQEAREEKQQLAANHFVAVHVADVLKLGLARLVNRGIVAHGQNPQVPSCVG